jgi:hypothetical protein
MDEFGVRWGGSNIMRWNTRHVRFESGYRIVSGFPKQPQNQNGKNHDAEEEAEQEQCRQQLANPVRNRG